MKKMLSLLLVLLMLLSLAACGEGSPGDATLDDTDDHSGTNPDKQDTEPGSGADKQYKENATIGVNWQVTSYDPNTNAITIINQMVFDPLIKFDKIAKELQPGLATSWEWADDDFKELKISLREGVTFHNGNPFTAEDVEFTLGRISNANIAGYYDHCEIEDDHNLSITLSVGCADFPYLLTNMLYAGIVDKESCEADPDYGCAVGTGPWIYDLDDVVDGYSWGLVSNTDYWGEVPVTKKITVRYIAEPTSRMFALQNKEIDAYMEVNVTNVPTIESDPDLEYCNAAGVGPAKLYFLAFNMARGKAKDNVYLRQAVACAIDNAEIIAAYGDPGAVESDGAFWGFDTPYRASASDFKEDLSHNVEHAKELVEKAKEFAGGEIPTLTLMGATVHDYYSTMVLAIQQECKAAGINVEIMETDGAGAESMTKYSDPGDHDMMVYSIPLESWASAVSRALIQNSNSNRATLDSDYITELLNEAACADEATREKDYIAIQTYVHDMAIYVPLYYGSRDGAQLAGTEGILWSNDGYPDFSYIRVPA